MNRKEIFAEASRLNLECHTWSPGDGVTRYGFFRFGRAAPGQTYFGPADGLYTALGAKDATAFLRGVAIGRHPLHLAAEVLWPRGDADAEWSADTAPGVADVLRAAGVAPEVTAD